jgi:hypothetical protein
VNIVEFLTNCPPGATENVFDCVIKRFSPLNYLYCVAADPDLKLDCEICNGFREFECVTNGSEDKQNHAGLLGRKVTDFFLVYCCRNCRDQRKRFALSLTLSGTGLTAITEGGFEETAAELTKVGEWPPFGPRTPARLITLIGPDRDLFLKGRRSEIQGLGIGAFAYYRRVVENQKNRLLDEFIGVSRKIGADDELIAQLEAAKKETRFSSAVDSIKHALPDSLLINGHNPLRLLHAALSEGIHEKADAECLEMATSIREVLAAMADRVGELLKDQKGLDAAINRLTTRKPLEK